MAILWSVINCAVKWFNADHEKVFCVKCSIINHDWWKLRSRLSIVIDDRTLWCHSIDRNCAPNSCSKTTTFIWKWYTILISVTETKPPRVPRLWYSWIIYESQSKLCSSQAIPGVGGHLHTPGHHGDTQGWGAPVLSDDQEWAPAPTYP